mmetsp:Transcript_26437/g.42697  ORF Transcript_26437/g.42697 Transcript_26437/m.42697 type:complete len:183 (+) Transcript_26437:246-794(+)
MESLGDSKRSTATSLSSSSSSSRTDGGNRNSGSLQEQKQKKPCNKEQAIQSALQSIITEQDTKAKKETMGDDERRWSCPPPNDDEKYFNGLGWKVIERGLDPNACYPRGVGGYMLDATRTSAKHNNRSAGTSLRMNTIGTNGTSGTTTNTTPSSRPPPPPRLPRPVPNTYVLVAARAEDCCT